MARSALDRMYALRPIDTVPVSDRVALSQEVRRGVAEQSSVLRGTATVLLMNLDETAGRGNPADADE
jgi:hypothetical protein